jgi:hypothetical protein
VSAVGRNLNIEVSMIPDTLLQVAIFALFVAPGIMYATVRVACVGFRGPDLGAASRVLEALFVGVIFDALYVLIFYQFAIGIIHSPALTISHLLLWQALLAVVLILGVPALVAAGLSLKIRRTAPDPSTVKGKLYAIRQGKKQARREERAKSPHWYRANGYRSTPLAWDFKALNMQDGQFVRVRTEGGLYYGGWYSRDSYMSTYPQPRDIFIECQWDIDKNGHFGKPILDAGGMWLPITDKCVVDWIKVHPAPELEKVERKDDK